MPPTKPKTIFREHCFHEYQPNLKGRNSYKRHSCSSDGISSGSSSHSKGGAGVQQAYGASHPSPVAPISQGPARGHPQARSAAIPIDPRQSGVHVPLPPVCGPAPPFPVLQTPQSVLEYVNQMQVARENLHLQQRMLERQMTVLSGFLAPELVQQLNTAQHELAAQLAQAQAAAHSNTVFMRRGSTASMQSTSPSLAQTPPSPRSGFGTPDMSLAIVDPDSAAAWDSLSVSAVSALPGLHGHPHGGMVAVSGALAAFPGLIPGDDSNDACTDHDEFDTPVNLLEIDLDFTDPLM